MNEPSSGVQPARDWDSIVNAIAASNNLIERDHFFRGWLHGTNYPLLISPQCRARHAAFFGATGSGKTSFGMLPLIVQAIRRRDASVLWFDLKGDDFVFETLRLEAERAGLPFKYFALESDKPSFLFQPFLQPVWQRLSVNEKTQIFQASLGLARSDDDPGTAYFEGCCESTTQNGFMLEPNVPSVRELLHVVSSKRFRIQSGMSRRDYENSGAVFAPLRRAAQVYQLNAVPGDGYPDAVFRDAIDLEECRARPSVTYFRLPATIEAMTARIVTRTAVRLLAAGGRMRGRAGHQTYCCIDEFQEVVQQSLAAPIKQAGDLGITFFLAMQSMSDLVRPGMNALDTVIGNTSMRDFFSAYEEFTRRSLSNASGQTYTTLESRTCSDHMESPVPSDVDVWAKAHTVSEGQKEMLAPRIDSNAINFVNSRRNLSIVEAAPMSGFTRLRHPVIVESMPMTTEEEYNRRRTTAWPVQTESTILGPPPPPPSSPPAAAPSASKPRPKPRRRSSAAKGKAEAQMADYLRQLAFPTEPRKEDQ